MLVPHGPRPAGLLGMAATALVLLAGAVPEEGTGHFEATVAVSTATGAVYRAVRGVGHGRASTGEEKRVPRPFHLLGARPGPVSLPLLGS